MWPFKKKYDYRVAIWIPSVDSMQLYKTLYCSIIRDKQDGLLYLQSNGKLSFKELFPGENQREFRKEELENYKKELEKCKSELKNFKKSDIGNYKNIERKIFELEFIIEKAKEESGTYVLFDNEGKKTIHYIRKSTGLHPLKYNIASNNVFLPKEEDSRDAFLSWKSKFEALQNKSDDLFKKLLTIGGAFFMIFLILGLSFFLYKIAVYDSELSEAKIESKYICQQIYEEGLSKIIATNQQTADNLKKSSEDIKEINNIDIKNEKIQDVTNIFKTTADILD